MEPMNLAAKLGEAMASSKEYIRLMEAEKNFKKENEARELIKKFKGKQTILNSSQYSYDIDIAELRRELTVLFEQIQKNHVIKELNSALDDFMILKSNLYDKMEDYISIDKEILSLGTKKGCEGCGGCKKI
ncbi:MAG: YlbF family regulator [Maledivibacter sp.]|jgi:cell fate (sporulation/competence/biofilm development) regulator YlbF (YheA/YmcA/DUF963 family)|nr:YlbF family regulator [Maledivibacter sp.]